MHSPVFLGFLSVLYLLFTISSLFLPFLFLVFYLLFTVCLHNYAYLPHTYTS